MKENEKVGENIAIENEKALETIAIENEGALVWTIAFEIENLANV